MRCVMTCVHMPYTVGGVCAGVPERIDGPVGGSTSPNPVKNSDMGACVMIFACLP